MKRVAYAALGFLLAVAIISLIWFKREYVVPADGLVGVSASRAGETIKVSGSLRSSSAKIIKTTTTRNGRVILLRVYADAIRETDDPRQCFGSFAVVITLEPDINSIQVGESSHELTLGRLWGMPIRLPLLRTHALATRVVWARQAGQ